MLARIAAFAVLTLLVGVIAGGSLYFLLTSTDPFVDIGAVMAPELEVSATGVSLVQGGEGRMGFRLNAGHADFDREIQEITLNDVDIDYFLAGGEVLNVRAPRGTVRQGDKTVRLWPESHVVVGESRMSCRELLYDGKHTLEGRGDVVITRPGVRMTAPAVFYDLDQRLFRVENGVSLVTEAP